MDPDQPVIGLESLGRDGRDVPLTNLQAIAARFVHEMRSLRPEGPYALGGISFGGMVALEMAQQLLASGQRVALLALLDTGLNPNEPGQVTAPWPTSAGALGQRLRRMASALLLGREGDRLGYLRVRARRVRRRIATRRWRNRDEIHAVTAQIGAGQQLPIAEALRHVRQANILAYKTYRPMHYHDAITLFYATEREDGDTAKEQWRALSDSLTVHPVPGNHTTMIDEPNAQVLARALSEALDLAHRETLEYARRA
jgi:thioesterase domain-containing protein